jgi:flagellar biosynthesis protein FlhF
MTYTAPSAAEAMRLVRDSLGDGAIIVSTQRDAEGGATRVTAALEEASMESGESGESDNAGFKAIRTISAVGDSIRRILTRHGTPERLAGLLAQAAAKAANERSPAAASTALAGALETVFTFNPIDPLKSRGKGDKGQPFILVGPPGGGKTVAAAKLAAGRTIADGGRADGVAVFTTDARRAGGAGQLEALSRILGAGMIAAETPDRLAAALNRRRPGRLTVIDTPGVNPFDGDDMAYLSRLIAASGGEPVLVLAAGGDAQETADMAHVFAELGVRRLIVSRLDVSRRVGGTLAAAHAGRFSFAGIGISPRISDPIKPLKAASLARLILARRNGSRNLDGIRQVEADGPPPRRQAS